MGMDPSVNYYMPQSAGWADQYIRELMKNLNYTPERLQDLTQGPSYGRLTAHAGMYEPMLQEYYSNLLRNPETTQAWDQQIRDIGTRNAEDRAARMMSTQEMGLFGPAHSATAAAAQRAMSQGDIDARLAAAQVAQQAQQYLSGERSRGATGLTGLGNELWSAPASLEMQLLGMNNARQMQNIANMLQAMSLRSNAAAQAGQLHGQQMVEPTVGPSDFDRFVAPLINALSTGIGVAFPYLVGGGGGLSSILSSLFSNLLMPQVGGSPSYRQQNPGTNPATGVDWGFGMG